MKKLLCLAVIGLSFSLGCAPSDNGGAEEESDTTSQIRVEPTQNLLAKC